MQVRAKAGLINIINRIVGAFESCGYKCLFKENTTANTLMSEDNPGYSLFHMDAPPHRRALTLRRAYYYPFWRIESTADRSQWQVAKSQFRSGEIDPDQAKQFVRFWRNRLFPGAEPLQTGGGFVFVPLQGRLTRRRSFQTMSPIDMLTVALANDPSRPILAKLHPGETYRPDEKTALSELVDANPRLNLTDTDTSTLVATCDYVVTQNSGLALDGFFHHKPAVMFADIDFHHIACNVAELGVEKAFSQVLTARPVFDAYLYWFLQKQSINAGREDAERRILDTVRARGWDV